MLTESITWHPVSERLPDADLTVLLAFAGTEEDSIEGFLDGHGVDGAPIWRDVTAVAVQTYPVTHWADKPRGPSTC